MKNKKNGNYTGNELSHAVKLHVAVLGVADIVRTRNSHSNFPTKSHQKNYCNTKLTLGASYLN